ncbi:MAG TPA: heme ABC exporter ATP-binding protein CcmA [Candidatus Binatia bacterium]|jgi:heme exporter protein A|nr:heme ABC exporter ATP-binding protein CcmA [Candidatus Binatia bacterium]
MNTWVVEAENLQKTFAWTPVLQGVSCRIGVGEVVGVFGPNGAGKTTFLRLLATLLKPSHGTLRLFGRTPHEPAVRRRLGFLGHDSFLYPDLTPIENLTFYGRAYGLSQVAERINTALAQIGLRDWGNTPVRTFSRGMEQRLALARALLHEPDLLLLDEPYTGLDSRGVTTLQTTLARAKAQGKTVVLTTHDFALGLELCDRALILHRGRLSWQSTGRLPSVQEFIEIYHAETQSSSLRTVDCGPWTVDR